MSVKSGLWRRHVQCTLKLNIYWKGKRTVYLFSPLVHFRKLAELSSSWHTHASHISISTADQSGLWLFEIRQPLCIVSAGSDKHLFIDVTNSMYIIQHKDKNKSVRDLPQLKSSKLWEGHCLHSLLHPSCGLLLASKFGKSLCPSYHYYCLPMRSRWFQWLTCELPWLDHRNIEWPGWKGTFYRSSSSNHPTFH